MSHPQQIVEVWSVEGRLLQLIFSPKGGIEGVLIETDGAVAQFVFDAHDREVGDAFADLRPGQALVIEGVGQEPSPKGPSLHTVYAFERAVSVDGSLPKEIGPCEGTQGRVARFNYARHGEANGVVLDNGDFVHTRPDGMKRLGLKLGAQVKASGKARALATGSGRVIEARSVNDKAMGPKHG